MTRDGDAPDLCSPKSVAGASDVDVLALAERLEGVRDRIAEAARAAGRSPDALTLVVVTKFQPAAMVRELARLGVTNVGESRHQEAQAKVQELADIPLAWHFIGQLQGNKARLVRRYASVVHSFDRASLADAFAPTASDPAPAVVDGFIEVNLTPDPGRGGVQPEMAEALVERVLAAGTVRLRGVMGVAPLGEEPRAAFARLRAVSERVRAMHAPATDISAGMSGDFAAAIHEGATHLRIGTAITGNRPPAR